MKITNVTLTAVALLTPFLFADEKGHEGHDHSDHGDKAHEHVKKIAGPNGGRVIVATEPHTEIFITKDRKVKITFLSDDNKAITPKDQTVSAIGGDRSSPTRMTFAIEGDSMISDKALPKGNMIPLILQIKTAAEGDFVTEKMTVDLSNCPTCEYQEYACTCDHGHKGHDHD
ncbi:MAG: hypothetical protein AB8D78_03190 [Akkermansiaceae bacterium]